MRGLRAPFPNLARIDPAHPATRCTSAASRRRNTPHSGAPAALPHAAHPSLSDEVGGLLQLHGWELHEECRVLKLLATRRDADRASSEGNGGGQGACDVRGSSHKALSPGSVLAARAALRCIPSLPQRCVCKAMRCIEGRVSGSVCGYEPPLHSGYTLPPWRTDGACQAGEVASLLRSGRVPEFLAEGCVCLYPTLWTTPPGGACRHPVASAIPRITVHSATWAPSGIA